MQFFTSNGRICFSKNSMETGSGLGSSVAGAGKDVATRTEQPTSRHLMMKCNLCEAVEPRIGLPGHFKRQQDPFIVMISDGRFLEPAFRPSKRVSLSKELFTSAGPSRFFVAIKVECHIILSTATFSTSSSRSNSACIVPSHPGPGLSFFNTVTNWLREIRFGTRNYLVRKAATKSL